MENGKNNEGKKGKGEDRKATFKRKDFTSKYNFRGKFAISAVVIKAPIVPIAHMNIFRIFASQFSLNESVFNRVFRRNIYRNSKQFTYFILEIYESQDELVEFEYNRS